MVHINPVLDQHVLQRGILVDGRLEDVQCFQVVLHFLANFEHLLGGGEAGHLLDVLEEGGQGQVPEI